MLSPDGADRNEVDGSSNAPHSNRSTNVDGDRLPSVSVVVPCYGYGRYLRDCVASLLSQTGVDLEVLVIDDASPDGTPQVARELAESDARVKYVRHAHNRGHLATYNHGLSLASGEFIALVSADDILTPGSLARASSALRQNPSASFAYGPVVGIDHDEPGLTAHHLAESEAPFGSVLISGLQWANAVCSKGMNDLSSPEVLVRGTAQRQVDGYRDDLPHAGDLEMWLRLATVGDVVELQGPVQAVHRWHKRNMSQGYSSKVDDLRQLELAFAVFESRAQLTWPERTPMLDGIRQRLARRSLRQAVRHIEPGMTVEGKQTGIGFLTFAGELDPSIRRSVLYRLARRAYAGDRRAVRLFSHSNAIYLNVRHSVRAGVGRFRRARSRAT